MTLADPSLNSGWKKSLRFFMLSEVEASARLTLKFAHGHVKTEQLRFVGVGPRTGSELDGVRCGRVQQQFLQTNTRFHIRSHFDIY